MYKNVAPRYQGISTATPMEDARVQYWQQEMGKPAREASATSNIIDRYAINSDRWQKATEQFNQANRELSAAQLQRMLQNQQITNQQAEKDAAIESDFRQRLAGTR